MISVNKSMKRATLGKLKHLPFEQTTWLENNCWPKEAVLWRRLDVSHVVLNHCSPKECSQGDFSNQRTDLQQNLNFLQSASNAVNEHAWRGQAN